jgi:transketolase N-terminal domain/subunit
VGNSNRVHSGRLASTSFGETLQQERRIRSIEEHTTNRVVKGHSSEALYVTQGRMGLLSDLRLFSAFTCLHPIIIFAAIDIRP